MPSGGLETIAVIAMTPLREEKAGELAFRGQEHRYGAELGSMTPTGRRRHLEGPLHMRLRA